MAKLIGRMRKTAVFSVAAIVVAIVVDGHVLGRMNWGRILAGRQPVFCRCIPHDGGGCWYRGITYTIFTSFEEKRFDSRMPRIQSESRDGSRYTPTQKSTSVDTLK